MYRHIESNLLDWKDAPTRKPLLVRGARQVGKSYSVEKFGREHFESMLLVNFELEPLFSSCFEHLDPRKVINALELVTQISIVPGKTLLFLDEIQQCPKAIMALRYFKEKMPELHVIGAGSFLEFVIDDERYQQPVGRVESLYMKPCSFVEFLLARGDAALVDYMSTVTLEEGIEPVVHEMLLERCREYFVVGGMPEAVYHYTKTQKIIGIEKIQASILEYYRRDLAKYHKKLNVSILDKLFTKVPALVSQHFKYADIDPDTRSRDQKPALDALIKAGVIHPVYKTSASGLPLHIGMSEKKFKLLFLDTGLVKHETKLEKSVLLSEELLLLNQGAIAEQFVGQELLAYGKSYEESRLFYWARDQRGSQAEVDYVIHVNGDVIPIEVKAGKTGRLRSLKSFMQERQSKLGVRVSQHPMSYENGVLSVPLYMIHELERLVVSL